MKCFKRRNQEHRRPKLPVTDEFERQNIDLVICIAGHEEGGGMTIYTGESENSFNTDLVFSIDGKTDNEKDIYIINRVSSSYRRYLRHCKKEIIRISKESGVSLKRILVLEFHLNDAGRSAKGVEYLSMTNASTAIGRPMVEDFSKKFNIVLRRDKGIYRIESGNGTGFLSICKSLGCPSLILEHCFAGHETNESSQFFNNRTEGIINLTDFFVLHIRDILDA